MNATEPRSDPGSELLRIVLLIQWILLGVGAIAWAFRGAKASLSFTVGGLVSIAFWSLHRILVVKMLTPKVRLRWFYGTLTLAKLALIILVLREMMEIVPQEGLPLATGILLFAAAILLMAGWQAVEAFRAPKSPND